MRKILVVTLLALVAQVSIAHATSFTDESAWRAAVGGVFTVETFDSIAGGSDVTNLPALGIHFLPLNDGTQPTVQPYSFTGGIVRSAPNNLLNDRDNTLPGRGPLQITPINPGDFLFGLGMWNVGGDDQLRLDFFDASNNLIESATSASAIGFFGIVNPAGATLAVVNFVQGNGYAPVDDLQTAARPQFAVPEPASLVLLGLGLVGLRLAHRRQSRHAFIAQGSLARERSPHRPRIT